jgi:hypothetical protein
MSRRRERIAKAEEGIAQLHEVLDSANSALEVAVDVDEAAVQAVRRGRKLLKWMLVLGGLAVVVMVAKKMLADPGDPGRDEIDLGEDRYNPAA